MSRSPKRVYVVDDEPMLRANIVLMLRQEGYRVSAYPSGEAFLAAFPGLLPGCIILDLRMEGMGGINLQRKLLNMGCHWPVIVLTGHADRGAAAEATEIGAVAFLTKPVRDLELTAALFKAQSYLLGTMSNIPDPEAVSRVESLTAREREALRGFLSGKTSKEMAAELGISESTVKSYRRRATKKLGASSAAELVVLAIRGGFIRL